MRKMDYSGSVEAASGSSGKITPSLSEKAMEVHSSLCGAEIDHTPKDGSNFMSEMFFMSSKSTKEMVGLQNVSSACLCQPSDTNWSFDLGICSKVGADEDSTSGESLPVMAANINTENHEMSFINDEFLSSGEINGDITLPTGFPKDASSLFVTGILDGAPVFYYDSENKVKNWALIIKDWYLCGCIDCQFVQLVTTVEFLCHSGCNFSRAKLQIYFKTEMSVEDVVEVMQKTPVEYFFEVLSSLTGCNVNERNFRIWNSGRSGEHDSNQVAGCGTEHINPVESPETPSCTHNDGA